MKAVKELETRLLISRKTGYSQIDSIMRKIMKKYDLTARKLHDDFVRAHGMTPDEWIREKLNESKEEKFRKNLEYAYELGSQVPSSSQTHISNIKTMTPDELAKNSGGSIIKDEIRKAQKRKKKAIDKLVKQHYKKYKTFEEFMFIVENINLKQ